MGSNTTTINSKDLTVLLDEAIKCENSNKLYRVLDKVVRELDSTREAFCEVLEGNSSWGDIHAQTGLPEERSKEIQKCYDEMVINLYGER